MADVDDLRQMVLYFRVSELQVLLGFAGRNKSGKKHELQARALELLKLQSGPIQMKIRELHKACESSKNAVSKIRTLSHENTMASSLEERGREGQRVGIYGASDNPTRPPEEAPKMHHSMHAQLKSAPYTVPRPTTASQPPTLMQQRSSMPMYNYPMAAAVAKHMTMPAMAAAPAQYPINPDVRLKSLPFYDVIDELVRPASLFPTGGGRFQESSFNFTLTPTQATHVGLSRDNTNKGEHTIQIQLRFCLLETSCEQEDNFPPSISVKVNQKMCNLPNPIPTNKPGVEPKRPSRPVNITPYCKLSPTQSNVITVSWASDYGRAYTLSVYLVKRLTSAQLLGRLRSRGHKNADHTRAMIKEKLQHDPDSEIATTSLRGSLICPLGKMRMQIPSRSMTCTHLQCFDASLYIQMNEKKPTWICPVCDKPATFNNLIIDGLFYEIAQQAPSECVEVQFHDNGSWSPIYPKKEPQVVSPSFVSSSPIKITAKRDSKEQGGREKKAKVEVIDLTLDSGSSTEEGEDDDDVQTDTRIQSSAVNPEPTILTSPQPVASTSSPNSSSSSCSVYPIISTSTASYPQLTPLPPATVPPPVCCGEACTGPDCLSCGGAGLRLDPTVSSASSLVAPPPTTSGGYYTAPSPTFNDYLPPSYNFSTNPNAIEYNMVGDLDFLSLLHGGPASSELPTADTRQPPMHMLTNMAMVNSASQRRPPSSTPDIISLD